MTPEEARHILAEFANTSQEAAEEAYVWCLVLLKTMGRPWRGDGPPSEEYLRSSARSAAMAKLHSEITRRKHTSEPYADLEEERQKMADEIWEEAVTELEEHGLPDAWKNAPEY